MFRYQMVKTNKLNNNIINAEENFFNVKPYIEKYIKEFSKL
jgi:hypothetical protein